MTCTPYQKKKLKTLGEVDNLVTLALAKLNRYAGGTYIGDLRELKDLIGVKLKLEQIQRRVAAGYRWEKARHERPSTGTNTKERSRVQDLGP